MKERTFKMSMIMAVIFIAIMLVMQFKIIPMTAGLSAEGADISELGLAGGLFHGESLSIDEMTRLFLYLLIVQGFFAGLTIGKLAEGNIKAGIKHSFILVVLAWLISTGAKAFF